MLSVILSDGTIDYFYLLYFPFFYIQFFFNE